MIIDNTYFKNEIYIPHAKPSVTDAVLAVEGDILAFIDEYARECLLSCLGRKLFYDFESQLDSANANGLKAGADTKWDNLLNGLEYQNPAGETVKWRGIRFKSKPSGDTYDKSLLAYYVYFYYEKHDYITRSDVGHVEEKPDNAFNVSPREKVVKAWNKFVSLVQGKPKNPYYVTKWGLIGVDYAHSLTDEVSLYEFIEDQNNLVPDTYDGFKSRTWERINAYGL